MSEEEKRATLEKLAKEIEQKEKILADLSADIQAREKTLEALNASDKSNNHQSLLQALRKQEEEVLNRDKQISNLYKRIEEMSKENASSLKDKNNNTNYEEMAQAWESQKVKYVEEIQNLSIELKKKNRLIEEKFKGYETTIQELEAKVKALEEANQAKVQEIEKSKQEIEKLKKELAEANTQKEEETKYLSEKFVGLKQDLGDLIKKKEDEISRLKEKVMVLNRDIEELNTQKEADMGKLRESVSNLEKQVDEVKAQKEEELKHLNERLAEMQKENDMLSEMNLKLRDSVKDREGSMKKLEEDAALLRKLKDDIKVRDEDLLNRKKEIGDLLTENNQLKSSMKNLRDTYEEAGRLIERQREQIGGLITELEKVNKELKDLKQKEKDRQAEEDRARGRKVDGSTQTKEAAPAEDAEKKHLAKTFEEKLQLIKEENEREMMKLSKMLEQTEAEKYDNIVALEDKERRLVELEEMNKTFEMLIQGLKKTILEVQEKMDKNGRYIGEMQKKLDAKEAELEALRPQVGDRDSQIIMMQNELEIREQRIAKLEKNLLQMIDEANSFKQRFKVANEKVNIISKGQIKEYEKQITSKDTEINILKEMLKSSKGVIRTKELEIQRLKQKGGHAESAHPTQGSPLKLPRLSSENFFQKDKGNFLSGKIPDYDPIKGIKQNFIKGRPYDKGENEQLFEDSPRDEIARHFPELMKGKVPLNPKDHDMIFNKDLNLSHDTHMFEEREREREGMVLPEIARKGRDSLAGDGDSRIDLSQDTDGRGRSKKNQMNIFDPASQQSSEAFEISPVKVTKRKTKVKSEIGDKAVM